MRRLVRLLLALAPAAAGCAAPAVTREGRLVFAPSEQRGAVMLTSHGVELVDRTYLPKPVVRRSAFEPWRPPTGFLLPRSGVLRERSRPVAIQGRGLAVVLRSSDAFVPAWGGELLVRLDAFVPDPAFPEAAATIRRPLQLAVVVDADSGEVVDAVEAALDHLGRDDRVALVDAEGGRTIVPLVPGTHRTLLEGAVERLFDQRKLAPSRGRRLARSLSLAGAWATSREAPALGGGRPVRRVLVVTDGHGVSSDRGAVARAARGLHARGVGVAAVAATDRVDREVLAPLGRAARTARTGREREDAVWDVVPPPGDPVLRDVVLSVASAPAPARVVEASGGELAMSPFEDLLDLGDLYVGEARTEVLRVAVPRFVPGEEYRMTVTARYTDDRTGRRFRSSARLRMRYTEDIELLADRRHGDVIAYASALAMVRRLERAFGGSRIDRIGGLRGLVRLQARSLAQLAERDRDDALALQAEVLATLLGWVEEDG